MSEENFRMQRIEKLFKELRYELERGFMEGEIEESMGYRFVCPVSRSIPNGVVHFEFRSRPVHRDSMYNLDYRKESKLEIVK